MKKELNFSEALAVFHEAFKKLSDDEQAELSEIYKQRDRLENVTSTVQLVAVYGGTHVAMVMIGSGVGAPFVLALGIFLVTVSLVAHFVKQPILDTTADKQRAHMLAWEKSNPGARYFLNMLDAHYHKRMPSLLNALASIQKIWHVDQLVVVTQMTNTSDMQELATVTKWGENLTSGKAYIEVFKNNQYAADKNVILDTENGIIELNNNDIRQGLIFTNPLLSPGTETVHRTQEGKNKYKNNLSFLAQKGWQIEDKGTAHTKADFSQVIQHGKAKEGTLRVISITANMGAGDDLVIVSTGATIVDGGQGNNAVDYSKLPARSSIKVRAEGNGYLVQKNIIGGHVLEETIEQKTTHYGKQSETLEYRSVKLITTNSQATDSLSNIQQIIASKGNDEMIGTDSSDQFYGGKGDDTIKTGKGNDIAAGGEGNDDIEMGDDNDIVIQDITPGDNDVLCGGNGEGDILDYSATVFVLVEELDNGTLVNFNARTSINVNLKNNSVEKYRENKFSAEKILIGKDVVKQFEVLIATQGDDIITLGTGKNIIYAEAGDDIIYQTTAFSEDRIDGGLGFDSVDYSAVERLDVPISGQPLWQLENIDVDLTTGAAKKKYNNKNGELAAKVDMLINIESIIGTAGADRLYGNHEKNLLNGGAGNNAFYGRGGNDQLIGGVNNDIYWYQFGDGNDTIEELGGIDTLYFKSPLTLDQLLFNRQENHLIVSFKENEGEILIKNHFLHQSNALEKIRLHHQDEYDVAHLIQHLAAPSSPTEESTFISLFPSLFFPLIFSSVIFG